MKKILILGGAFNEVKNFRIGIISQMVLDGFDVYVLSLDYTEDDRLLIKSVGAVPVSYTGRRGGLNPFRELSNFLKLIKTVRSISPDYLFSYFTKQVIMAGIITRLYPVKVSVGLIEGLGYGFGLNIGSLSLRLHRILLKIIQITLYNISLHAHSRVLFLNSDDPLDLSKFLLFRAKNFEVLGPIGVDLVRLVPKPFPDFGTIRFIFVGRLLVEKGIVQYIEAAGLIKRRFPNVVFTVVGGIDYDNPNCISRNQLNSAISNGLIEHYGHVHDPWNWISNSHVFVLPSYYREGFPRSTQEAMALGRPVITTMSVGCRESVIDGFDGFLVEPLSSEKLAEKMAFFIDNPCFIELFGANARRSAESRFNEIIFNSKLLKLFKL